MLKVIDEFTRECLAIRIGRKLKAFDVIDTLSDLFILRGVPGYIRSDNGPEFGARAVREWIAAVGARTAYIMPGSPWENGHCESFNSKLPDELLNGEIFYTLEEARVVIEGWRQHYNTVPAALIIGLSTARTGSNSVAGFASYISFAGHTGGSATNRHALPFKTGSPNGCRPPGDHRFHTDFMLYNISMTR